MEANKVRPVQAKDTVMDTAHIEEVVWVEGNQPLDFEALERVAQTQAEISFKAGMREVAECVNDFMVLHAPKLWPAKKKEWGIGEEVKDKSSKPQEA